MTDIFDPRHYEKVRLPALEAETLPAWAYTSRDFFDREIERMFKKVWNFLGRADEVPNPGDYKCFDLVAEPIVVLRDQKGQFRAFANTCRHRGTRLLDGAGNCKGIPCPYHAWTYALSGELIGAPGMEETIGFDKRDFPLIPIRLESWEGFLFVTFDEAAESLMSFLGDLPEKLRSYNFADMVCVRQKDYELACNWKLYLENAMEEYHTPTVHRASIGKQITVREESRGAWDGMHMPSDQTIAVLAEDLAQAFPQIPTLEGKAAKGTYFLVIYPATFFAVTQDCMWWLQQFPLAPDRTRVVIGSCFPRSTVARPDFAEKVERYYKRWDKSLPEDNAISERQQAGLRSSAVRPGRLSSQEQIIRDIANWVLDRVL